ncbi:hypothetical protein [Pseudomonas sp. TAE6080]|uniref:hypothetical protein n=1 Tax=Pseudomonas sp. TAE6080 TaxID=2840374 RepID=UPI001C005A40|nr:hypothetical protein [Pseudomonas sp. TAE6080]MBT9300676.1 hypothetical protein [Pseudomonas sp. TAE6080]
MMLLRTLVLEHSGHDSPVNGALLCCFAIPQIASNFLVYSLDEEVEPGSSRVYIAALRKKTERYFLGGIESKESLQLAMSVLKQIITLATGSGVKDGNTSASQVPYHFIDLKGSKLPTARPEDHHSLMIKKALVMKVITLGTSVIGLPAIESTELIVPSIRFSSKMVSPPGTADGTEVVGQGADEEPSVVLPVAAPADTLPSPPKGVVPQVPAPRVQQQPVTSPEVVSPVVAREQSSLLEVDTTLTNLARVAQELTQQKRAVFQQQEELEQHRSQLLREKAALEQANQQLAALEVALQQRTEALNGREEHLSQDAQLQQAEQRRLEGWARQLEDESFRLQALDRASQQQAEQLATGLGQLSGFRGDLKGLLYRLDGTLFPVEKVDRQQDADAGSVSGSD